MPFTEDGYEPYSEEELYNSLRTRFENQFGSTVTPGDIVDEMLRAEAGVMANFQEEMISRVYDAAFVELASGDQLTMKAREAGVIRQDAIPATGVVTFSNSNPVTQDRTIDEGTVVQTGGSDIVEFETLNDATIKYIDGFEDGLDESWSGDLGDASVVSENTYAGENEVKLAAVDGSEIHKDVSVTRGTNIHVGVFNTSNTVAITRFGVQDSNNCYRVATDASSGSLRIEKVEAGTVNTLDEANVAIPTGEYLHLSIEWGLAGDITVTLTDSADNYIDDLFATNEQTFDEGGVGFKSGDANGVKYWDELTTQSVSVNVEAIGAGNQTNVNANAISTIPQSVFGVESVTNQIPIGNENYLLIGGERQVRGIDEEGDDELQERVFNSLSGGGQGTKGALYTAVSNIDNVVSLSIFTNEKSVDNTGTGGLPPYSSEIVVYGGNVDEIVGEIYDTMSFIDFLRLHSGSHGSSETYDVYDETLDENYTGEISRPPKVPIEVEVDLVFDTETYAGESAVGDAIVDYVGGQDSDGESIIGLGVGDDVYKSRVRNVVSSLPGVIGVTNLVLDSDGDGTDNTVADADGLSIIDVSESNVAQVNAYENAVTVNETER